MKNKENKARKIMRNALKSVLELGYHVIAPSTGAVSPRNGHTISRVDQLDFQPIPDELKRQMKNDEAK